MSRVDHKVGIPIPWKTTLQKKRLPEENHLNSVLGVEASLSVRNMTPNIECQDSLKFTRPMLILTTRETVNISIWNVRTLREARRSAKVPRKLGDKTWRRSESVKFMLESKG